MRHCINPAAPFAETDRMVADMLHAAIGPMPCESLAMVIAGAMAVAFIMPLAAFAYAALSLR
jgi:hypothetical protein